MLKFKCENCIIVFDNEGVKKEYFSPIYGPCFKYVSQCPNCKAETNEYRSKNSGHKSVNNSMKHSCGECCCNQKNC